ncbi:DUF1073 domain-containing protein (plasmid) [Azospirillum baldaniorum]|uniref:Anti-CBASS protein Acb1-like N-terminal domain-containing protein n=1 Tax=Azospirillum baldaniorum TaxID=1064539 RepID=A0A9P1JZT4_9PROT|nr:DUF1073 domain-containing protein [Azospirillum baldaniorum]AWJ93308.1 DUF1073 domain-containing protein [Azospirillum baldaniorum]TWA78009.1 hypothetical protein FBZ85_106169 [Azospirillum brasilense]CCD02889.1 conserved protein of unknown function [Azospirillum baldaniorum]
MTTQPKHSKRPRGRGAAPAQDAAAPVEQPPAKPKMRVTHTALIEAARKPGRPDAVHPFVAPSHPPGVAPKGSNGMAMDSASDASAAAMFAWAASSAWHEGQQFLGYAYLSELAQRPEYRRISETLAQHMTRKWIKIRHVGDGQNGDDGEDKSDKIAAIEAEFKRLGVQEAFRKIAEDDGFFGRSHLYLDTGSTEDPEELKKPISSADGTPSPAKVKRGSLKAVRPVEAVWCYPTAYNSNDPLNPGWYNPESWFVMGKEVHGSRLLTFIGREVPDMLKPAYSFGGLSLSQIAKPYVDNWLRTRQSVADIVSAFSVMVLKTDLLAQMADGEAADELFRRIDLFNSLRDNRGVMAVDKNAEDFANVSAPLSGLDVLQAQTQEHMSAVSGIPIVILLGIQPAGLNASSEGELQAFYDHVHSLQERFFRPNLERVLQVVQLSKFGEIDPDIGFEFEPLRSLDEKEQAEVRFIEAQTGAIYQEIGAIDAPEIRERLIRDEGSPYSGLSRERSTVPPAGEEGGGIPPLPGLEKPAAPAAPPQQQEVA